jgi:cob(I)alamin adenosyltransferase
MKIYTLTGDDGSTSLHGGRRVPKHSLRVEAYGTVDELVSWVGLLRTFKETSSQHDFLLLMQDQLMRCAVSLASDNPPGVLPSSVFLSLIESEIDKMEAVLPELKHFIIPGGSTAVSNCHIARCVCRRAERCVLRLKESETVPGIINKILNRLSDYLFVLARHTGYSSGYQEIKWPVAGP